MPYLGNMNHDEVMHALMDVGFKGYFTLECDSSAIKRYHWLGPRRVFDKDTRLVDPPMFLQRGLERLMYETAEYILSSYGVLEK